MTAQLSPPPVFRAFDGLGLPLFKGQLTTYQAGTLVPQATYVDSTQTTQNANPIVLNARGECALWLDPAKAYKFALTDQFGNNVPGWPVDNITIGNANPSFSVIPTINNLFNLGSPTFSWANVYLGANGLPLVDALGNAGFYIRTPAEFAASITPLDYFYPEGVVNRYGFNTTPGTTDMTQAIKNAVLVNAAGGSHVQFLDALYLVNDTAIAISATQPRITVRGIPFGTRILNKAAASKPTIKLSGATYFDIAGLVLIGATGFTNDGLAMVKDGSANRCAFGVLRDIVCQTNGYGIEIQDTNTVDISNFSYWPSGGGSFGGTIDVNGQPAALYASGTGAVNGITLHNINVGAVNSIANGGCGIKVDGSASVGAFLAWEIDGIECESSGTRAIWFRNANIFTVRNAFVENTEVRIDQGCVRGSFFEIEGAASATVVVDGTQSLGSCRQLTFMDCQAGSFTADATNAKILHIGCNWNVFADNCQDRGTIKTEGTGSVYVVDSLNKSYRFKGSLTARASTTTLADDPDLIVTNLPKGTYLLRCFMQFFGTTTGTQGYKFALRVGGGIAGSSWLITSGTVNSVVSNPNTITPANVVDSFGTIATALNDQITFDAFIATNGAGDIALQWAQNSSSANNTNLSNGSWFTVERIG